MKKLKAFTLIEMGIVIFIISVLAGIIIPNLTNYIKEAEKATDFANAALLYNDTLLVLMSDDDAYFSFYNIMDSDSGRSAQYPVLRTKTVNIDGKSQTVEYWEKSSQKTNIVTRCSGVDAAQAYALAKKQNMGYDTDSTKYGGWSGLHDPWYNSGADKKGKNVLYTWEPVSGKNCGSLQQKNDSMKRDVLRKRVKEGTEYGEYFTAALSVKMGMPVWGDTYYGGTLGRDGNASNGKVDYSKSHFRMRYTKGVDRAQGYANTYASTDYAWEWMITYDSNTGMPIIYAGNGQTNLVRPVYPNVSAEEVLAW